MSIRRYKGMSVSVCVYASMVHCITRQRAALSRGQLLESRPTWRRQSLSALSARWAGWSSPVSWGPPSGAASTRRRGPTQAWVNQRFWCSRPSCLPFLSPQSSQQDGRWLHSGGLPPTFCGDRPGQPETRQTGVGRHRQGCAGVFLWRNIRLVIVLSRSGQAMTYEAHSCQTCRLPADARQSCRGCQLC